MRGEAVACGGLTVLNAIASNGFGGAIQLAGLCAWAEVRVRSSGFHGYSETPWGRLEMPRILLEAVAGEAGVRGLEARVESTVPPASGLKSSSALTAALVSAAFNAVGAEYDTVERARAAVRVSRKAGLTVTGAFDDHIASLEEGVHITYNLAGDGVRLLRIESPCLPAVIGIPRGASRLAGPRDYEPLRSLYLTAVSAALSGDWITAMRLNGLLTAVLLGLAEPVVEAYREGSMAAGVTGKGPTLFSLTRDPQPVADRWARSGFKVIVSRVRGGGC